MLPAGSSDETVIASLRTLGFLDTTSHEANKVLLISAGGSDDIEFRVKSV